MGELTIYVCDQCNREYREDGMRLSFMFGERQDPVEGTGTAKHKVDLCQSCVQAFVRALIGSMSESDQKMWHDIVRKRDGRKA